MMKSMIYRTAAELLPVLSRVARNRDVGIIMTHGVHDEEARVNPPKGSISLKSFQRSILAVGRSHSFVSMDEVAAMMSGDAPWRERSLALTFDDSLNCHAKIIAPKLFEWGIPATFYLSTRTIDRQEPYWWLRLEYAIMNSRVRQVSLSLPGCRQLSVDCRDRGRARQELCRAIRSAATPDECMKAVESVEIQLGVNRNGFLSDYQFAAPMTWNDARELTMLGMTIGSHTVTHPNLNLLAADELRSEFVHSRDRIEQSCARPCRHLCYPHGYYSDAVCKAADAAGYLTAVTTEVGRVHPENCNPLSLPRIAMPGSPYKLAYVIACSLLRN